tara:strand:+ start:481 stop:1758 length:1278 start_codon:yes stop_codon:yes gene_type:complete
MISYKVNTYLSYIVISIPILLITGPFLPDLALSLSGLIFFYFLLTNKKINTFNNLFSKLFLFFTLILIINSIYSGNEKSIISSLGYIRFLLFIFLVVYILKHQAIDLKLNLFYSMLFCTLFLLLEFFSQAIFGITLLGRPVNNPTRLVLSSFYHEEILSSYLVRFYPLLIGLYFICKKKLNLFFKLSFFLLSFSVIFVVIYNGERTSLGLLCLSLFLMIIFSKQKYITKIIIFASITILTITLLLNLPNFSIDRKLSGFQSIKNTIVNVKKNTEKSKIVIISDKYNSMYRTSYNIYKENKLFGVGIKNFRVVCGEEKYAFNKRSCSTHPHNLFLQIMAETGLVGIFYYFLIIFSIIFFFIKNLVNKKIDDDKKNYLTCLFITIFISVFPFFPSGNFFNNWLSIFIFFPVGFLLKEILTNDYNKIA